jgi:hypothetical protein
MYLFLLGPPLPSGRGGFPQHGDASAQRDLVIAGLEHHREGWVVEIRDVNFFLPLRAVSSPPVKSAICFASRMTSPALSTSLYAVVIHVGRRLRLPQHRDDAAHVPWTMFYLSANARGSRGVVDALKNRFLSLSPT